MNRRIGTGSALLFLLSTAMTATAGETVARWVDAEGVTHFGDVQLAPSHAARQDVGPANGMEAPEVPATRSAANGPTWSIVDLPPKRNPIGWRNKGDGPENGPLRRRGR